MRSGGRGLKARPRGLRPPYVLRHMLYRSRMRVVLDGTNRAPARPLFHAQMVGAFIIGALYCEAGWSERVLGAVLQAKRSFQRDTVTLQVL